MDEVVVPPAPHWYKSSVLACAPDNTLVYGAKNDIVVVRARNPEVPKVEIIHSAHSKNVVSVSLNRKWQEPHSYVASLGEDNIIKIWNLDTFKKKTSNKDHTEHKDAVIGAVFAGDDRVVSAAVNGLISVWNINTNETKIIKDLFKFKASLTCLSSCPHAGWLVAFGVNNGIVVVADLRRNGQILYSLRGHYHSVNSLSWCPAPVNVFPQSPNNVVKNKSPKIDEKAVAESAKSSGTKREEKGHVWASLLRANDNKDRALESNVFDFLKECDDLTNKILGIAGSSTQVNRNNHLPVTKEETPKQRDDSDSGESDRFEEVQNRPFPQIYDPSGDFLDDSGVEDESSLEEKDEDTKTERVIEIAQKKEAPENECEGKEDLVSESKSKNPEKEESEEKDKNMSSGEQRDACEKSKEEKNEENILESKDLDQKAENASENSSAVKDAEVQVSKTDVPQSVSEAQDTTKSESEGSTVGKNEAPERENILKTAKKTPEIELNQDNAITVLEEEPRIEYLLASAARDRSVYIWRAGTDGRMQTFFSVGRKANRRQKNVNSWISLCWITPNTLLTSSATGEILAWCVPKPIDSSKQYSVVHSTHMPFVFNIVAPPKYFTPEDWLQEKYPSLNVWSWSQDGKLIHYDLNLKKMVHLYYTVTSSVTCFGPSAVDPNRLAVGMRDGGIYIWDLSAGNSKVMSMQKHQQKFTQKVSSVAWHPHKEMIVAFGTEEGRVGFIDLHTKKFTMFPCYFRTQVYKLEWGPLVDNVNQELGLYVLSNGQIAIHNINTPNAEPKELEVPDNLYIYKFAWKPSLKLLLLNGKDGTLIVLKDDLTVVSIVYPCEKPLKAISWHPDALVDDSDVTSRCHWFAATTNKGVTVFNCHSLGEDNFANRIVAIFDAHVKPPTALDWSPFDGNKLVSTSVDGLTQVYDLASKSVIATFVNSYISYNVTVTWSPVDPDLVIVGDKLCRIWSIKQNPPKCDDEFLAARKRLLNKTAKSDEKPEKNKIKVEIPKSKVVGKNSIVPCFHVAHDGNVESQIATMKNLMNGVETLEEHVVNPFHVFGGKDAVSHLLKTNYEKKQRENSHQACELISLWRGDLSDHIGAAIRENRVTPSIITLAPMVSVKLWQDACLTYAQSLADDPNADPQEAATYFLACHKVQEAINCLCLNYMFKEALVLAKQRLPEGCEIITSVVNRWGQQCTFSGNFENAAYCYISIKDYENAAKVLTRRNHKEYLEFAVELAEKTENKALIEAVKFKYNEVRTVKKDAGGDGSEAALESSFDNTDRTREDNGGGDASGLYNEIRTVKKDETGEGSQAELKSSVDQTERTPKHNGGGDYFGDMVSAGSEDDKSDKTVEKTGDDTLNDIAPSRLEALMKRITDTVHKISNTEPAPEIQSQQEEKDEVNKNGFLEKLKEKEE